MNNLLEHIEQSVHARKLFRRDERILVAVSGGVDSMVLLHSLNKLASKFNWKLAVAHFNHQLRGRASDGDEQFVKRAAKSLGLKCFTGRGEVKTRARREGKSVEMMARELRHQFLVQTAKKFGARCIALAHHADDQVELFLLRLLRGAGGEGLAGMKWQNQSPASSEIQLVRPLLDLSKGSLNEFLEANRLRFRNDASNKSHDILRNRIRHELLPLIESRYQTGFAKAALRLMAIVGAESEFASKSAADWLRQNRRQPFDRLAVAVQRQCLRLQLLKLNISPDFELVERLRLEVDRPVAVSPTVILIRDSAGDLKVRTSLRSEFSPREMGVILDGRSGKADFDGVRCQWLLKSVKHTKLSKRTAGREFFDAKQVGTKIKLRHWRAGDRFQPIGMATSLKLQDWFTNQKIARKRRHELLVAESESGEIFWVENMRISERFKITSASRRALIWHWQRH